MAANKIFSPKRFGLLMYNDLLIHFKGYVLYITGIGVFMYIIMTWAMYISWHFTQNDYIPFSAMFGIVLLIVIGTAFPSFNNKVTAANYILLPASTLEKFLSQFLIRVVITIVLFMFIFHFATDLAQNSFSPEKRIMLGKQMIEEFSFSELWNSINSNLRDKIAFLFMLFSLMSFFFSTRLFFGKYAAIKTFITGTILVFGFIGIMILFSFIFYPDETSWYRETIALKEYEICKDLNNTQLYAYLVAYISWIFFLVTGYFKFKEKQV
ncbi:MAG: hypothetical protein LBE04_02260 [Prevotellaceae bacterium]|jgi:hypothetical protein|nr:hypothetical protein [Prevotellaceae bacterium]